MPRPMIPTTGFGLSALGLGPGLGLWAFRWRLCDFGRGVYALLLLHASRLTFVVRFGSNSSFCTSDSTLEERADRTFLRRSRAAAERYPRSAARVTRYATFCGGSRATVHEMQRTRALRVAHFLQQCCWRWTTAARRIWARIPNHSSTAEIPLCFIIIAQLEQLGALHEDSKPSMITGQ